MTVSYQNQKAIRRLPVTPTLEARIREAVAALGPGYQAQIYSGGQPSAGQGRRIGSTRHDSGKAADIYITGPDGKRVQDNSLFGKVKDYWHGKGYGGVGIGMAGGGIHLDEHTDRPNFWTYNGVPKTAFGSDVDSIMKGGEMTPQQAIAQALMGRKPQAKAQPQLMMKPQGLTGAPEAVAPAQAPAPAPQLAPLPDAADPAMYERQLQSVMDVQTPDGLTALAKALTAGLVSYQQGSNDKKVKDRQAAITQRLTDLYPDNPLLVALASTNPEIAQKIAIAEATKDPLDKKLKQANLDQTVAETNKLKNPQSDKLSLNPVFMTDETGNTVIGQLGADGVMRKTQLPAGTSVATGVKTVDLGTTVAFVDNRTGQVVGVRPKDVAGEASAKKSGEAQGVAASDLPDKLAAIDSAMNVLSQVERDPALPNSVGILSQYRPIFEQDGRDFTKKVDQMSSQVFLSLADTLKGVLTEQDAKALREAGARLDRAQSEPAFRAALTEYRATLERTRRNAIAKAGGQQTAPQPRQQPSIPAASPSSAPSGMIMYDAQGNRIP